MLDGGEREIRQREGRERCYQRPDGADAGLFDAVLRVEESRHPAAHHHGDNHVRQLGQIAFGQNPRNQCDRPHREHPRLSVEDVAAELEEHFVEVRTARDVQAKEVLDLAGGDQDGGARRETDDDRVGDEVHQSAEPGQTHGQLDQSGQQSEREDQAHKLCAAGFGQRADRGKYHNRNCGRGPRYQMPA